MFLLLVNLVIVLDLSDRIFMLYLCMIVNIGVLSKIVLFKGLGLVVFLYICMLNFCVISFSVVDMFLGLVLVIVMCLFFF